ncbi:MAG: type II toxin-antitoxin system RelE/ParE family toxin [Caldilineaceae bacterium]
MPELWQVQIHRKVNDVVYALPPQIAASIHAVMRQLQQNPDLADSRLVGSLSDVFEVFVSQYRLVYQVEEDKKLVKVVRVHLTSAIE